MKRLLAISLAVVLALCLAPGAVRALILEKVEKLPFVKLEFSEL